MGSFRTVDSDAQRRAGWSRRDLLVVFGACDLLRRIYITWRSLCHRLPSSRRFVRVLVHQARDLTATPGRQPHSARTPGGNRDLGGLGGAPRLAVPASRPPRSGSSRARRSPVSAAGDSSLRSLYVRAWSECRNTLTHPSRCTLFRSGPRRRRGRPPRPRRDRSDGSRCARGGVPTRRAFRPAPPCGPDW